MKIITKFIVFILLISGVFNLSHAQDKYPSRPVEVVALWQVGGTLDLATRALCEAVKNHFGQPWIIIERPGAGGMIGMAYVARAKPDGYTITAQVGTGQIVTNFFLQEPEFKQSDLKPVIQWNSYQNVIAGRTDSSWKTMMDMVEYAKKNPGAIKYATVGKGSSPHFQFEVLSKQMDIKLTPVFYKGQAEAITSVLDGIIPIVVGCTYDSVKEHVRRGKLRFLMTFTPKPIEEAPEIPTFKQALSKDQRLFPSYCAIFVPKGTPEDRKKFIHDCAKKALEDPDFRRTMRQLNFPIAYSDGETLKKRIQEETKIIGELIKELGIAK